MRISALTFSNLWFILNGTEGWKSALLKYIDPSQLPVHWGGELLGPDGDPECSHKVRLFFIKEDCGRSSLARTRGILYSHGRVDTEQFVKYANQNYQATIFRLCQVTICYAIADKFN